MPTVSLPNGKTVQFPDTMSSEQINSTIETEIWPKMQAETDTAIAALPDLTGQISPLEVPGPQTGFTATPAIDTTPRGPERFPGLPPLMGAVGEAFSRLPGTAEVIPTAVTGIASFLGGLGGGGIQAISEMKNYVSMEEAAAGRTGSLAESFKPIVETQRRVSGKIAEKIGYEAKTPGGKLVAELLAAPIEYKAKLINTYMPEKYRDAAHFLTDVALVFGPKFIKAVGKSNAWRMATIKERGLMVLEYDKVKGGGFYSEAELARKNPVYAREAAKRRATPEAPVTPVDIPVKPTEAPVKPIEVPVKPVQALPEVKPPVVKKPIAKVVPKKVVKAKDIRTRIIKGGGIDYKREQWKGELDALRGEPLGQYMVNKEGKGHTLDEWSMMLKDEGWLRPGEEATPQNLLDAIYGKRKSVEAIEEETIKMMEKKEVEAEAQRLEKTSSETELKLMDELTPAKQIQEKVRDRTINPLVAAEGYLKRGEFKQAIEQAERAKKQGAVLQEADGPVTDKLIQRAVKKADAIIEKARAAEIKPALTTPKIKVSKVKPTQPDMIGVPKDVLKDKMPSKELPETPLEKATREVKGRKVAAEEAKRQVKIPERGLSERVFKSESGLVDLEALSGESTSKGKKVMRLVAERRKDIDIGELESAAFITKLNKLTKPEREAVSAVVQRMFDPDVLKKIDKEYLIPMVSRPSETILKAASEVSKYLESAHEFNKEHWGESVGYKENYVTQIWDIPKAKTAQTMKGFILTNPFLRKRKIPSFEEGIKMGLTPKTLDISEILRTYDHYRIQSAFNARFVDSIQNLKVLNENTGELEPLVKRADKAPDDWVLIDHPALSRAKAIGKVGEKGLILKKMSLKVHPEIAREVKIIFDKPFSHPAIQAIETINAFAKKGQLSISFFHHLALGESALSSGIGRKALGLFNPFRIYRAMKHGDYEIFRNMEVAKDNIAHGGTFGALSDVHRGRIEKALSDLEFQMREVPVAKQLTKGLRTANMLWDKFLWDYVHNTLKLYAYESNVLREFKRKNMTPEEITKMKKSLAIFGNNSFGGQNWDLNPILGNPKMKQLGQLSLLSLDWTVSTLKQATAPLKAIRTGDKVLFRRSMLFWLRAGIYFNLIVQSLNYYNSEKKLGEGRFTWENDPGHKLNIFVGFNEDGTKKYLRMGKQFREVLEWGQDPLHKLGAKLSPTVREAMRQLTKHDPGSGYPTPWKDKGFWESLPERAKSIAEMPLPFSLRPYIKDRPTNFMLMLPASRGMTNYKTRTLFHKALKANNEKRIERIYFAALENNLDADRLLKSAEAFLGAEKTYDDKKVAKKIFNEISNVGPEAKEDLIRIYAKRGVLTPDIKKHLNKLLSTRKKVQRKLITIKQKRNRK